MEKNIHTFSASLLRAIQYHGDAGQTPQTGIKIAQNVEDLSTYEYIILGLINM